MIKTVRECDYCNDQVDWAGKSPEAIPEGWRSIQVSELDHTAKVLQVKVFEVCDKHDNLELSTILGTCMA